MRRRSLALVVVLVGAVAAHAEQSATPVYHAYAHDAEGEPIAEYLLADDHDSEPPSVVGILRTAAGLRGYVFYSMDPDKGVVTQRFTDLQSGWWIELTHNYGMLNLGRASDYPDPMQWTVTINDRVAREKPTSTYVLRTSDGDSVEWLEPWGETSESEGAQVTALARFAGALAESGLPSTAGTELAILLSLLESPEGRRLDIAESLLEKVDRVLLAAELGENAPRGLRLSLSSASVADEPTAKLLDSVPRRQKEGAEPDAKEPQRQQP